MHSLSPDTLARMRFDAQQVATLRTPSEYQGKQRLYVATRRRFLTGLRQVAIVESTELSNRSTAFELRFGGGRRGGGSNAWL